MYLIHGSQQVVRRCDYHPVSKTNTNKYITPSASSSLHLDTLLILDVVVSSAMKILEVSR